MSLNLLKPARAIALAASALLLGACSNLEFPWVYRIDIDQGNIITQEMIDQLKPGLSRDQVKFVMGSPLVIDPFHPDRWDYVYTLRKGDGTRKREQLSVYFKDDTLVSLSGDFLPASAQTSSAAPTSNAPTQTN
ncbi:MAG: outer membrane protein assembly factor BamE [Spongiibacteraceae bacterium]